MSDWLGSRHPTAADWAQNAADQVRTENRALAARAQQLEERMQALEARLTAVEIATGLGLGPHVRRGSGDGGGGD